MYVHFNLKIMLFILSSRKNWKQNLGIKTSGIIRVLGRCTPRFFQWCYCSPWPSFTVFQIQWNSSTAVEELPWQTGCITTTTRKRTQNPKSFSLPTVSMSFTFLLAHFLSRLWLTHVVAEPASIISVTCSSAYFLWLQSLYLGTGFGQSLYVTDPNKCR